MSRMAKARNTIVVSINGTRRWVARSFSRSDTGVVGQSPGRSPSNRCSCTVICTYRSESPPSVVNVASDGTERTPSTEANTSRTEVHSRSGGAATAR